MQKSKATTVAMLSLAALLMLASLASDTVDLASQDYRVVLSTALATTIIADILCVPSFLSRGRERWFAVLIALPSPFIVWDVARRAPYVFSK